MTEIDILSPSRVTSSSARTFTPKADDASEDTESFSLDLAQSKEDETETEIEALVSDGIGVGSGGQNPDPGSAILADETMDERRADDSAAEVAAPVYPLAAQDNDQGDTGTQTRQSDTVPIGRSAQAVPVMTQTSMHLLGQTAPQTGEPMGLPTGNLSQGARDATSITKAVLSSATGHGVPKALQAAVFDDTKLKLDGSSQHSRLQTADEATFRFGSPADRAGIEGVPTLTAETTTPALATPSAMPTRSFAYDLTGPSDGQLLGEQKVVPANGSTSTRPPSFATGSRAPHVMAQLTAAISQTTTGTTEIALSPKELGRVRMTLTQIDAGLIVTIAAERVETTDLMRRNLDQLARDLRDLGYDNPTFTFDDQHDSRGQSTGDDNVGPTPSIEQEIAPLIAPTLHTTVSVGLDLKL